MNLMMMLFVSTRFEHKHSKYIKTDNHHCSFVLQTFKNFYSPLDQTFNMANHGAFAPDDDHFKENREYYHNVSMSLYPNFTKCDLDAAIWHFRRKQECYGTGFDIGGLGNSEAFSFGKYFHF